MSVVIGQTRNLTQQFVRYRNDAKRARLSELGEPGRAAADDDRATAKLLGAALARSSEGGGGDVELGRPSQTIPAAYAPRWITASENIKSEMTVVRERLGKLKELHAKALLVSFDDASSGVGPRVEALTHEIQLAFRRLDGEVRGIAAAPPGGGRDGDAEVRLQVQRQLAQALFKLTVEFRKEETRFLNKMEAQKGYEQGSSLALAEGERGGSGGGAGEGAAAEPGFTQAQVQKVSQAEAMIEERETEIRKVVETITELAQVMRDLSTLVVEQGTLLDRIEEGTKELVKAEETQRSGRALRCIALLLVLIVVFLIATIVRHA
ncbi:hypothetical protein Rsub_03348 [Raphidocelis subcapitata]|uniref:t-SNARE coiled-coil homology domain-containing protein n=1 Tax=Raphidocelis subcapitata TaxID=307507 RepID=A0A2V0NZH5_9CHLO|nr:hypothetical protein Rsub_03348 [Raphidocelis subcapitata]|eukprot:GBF90215.1 hypothetical protein Rsub_03348 [Raphidocelis subcapitata]